MSEVRPGDMRMGWNSPGCMYTVLKLHGHEANFNCKIVYVCACHLGDAVDHMTYAYASGCVLLARENDECT